MKFRHLSAAAIILVAVTAGCRHRPALSEDYEPRDLPWKERLFGSKTSKSGAGSGGSGGDWKNGGNSGKNNKGGKPPKVTHSSLDQDDLFTTKGLGDNMSVGINGVEERWKTVVYFAYNKSFIGEAERPKLEQLADYLTRNSSFQVIVEGHCDERGSEEFNRALGERRAIALREYLGNLGVSESRVKTISYGEERLNATGATEADHAQNRRGEFIVVTPKP